MSLFRTFEVQGVTKDLIPIAWPDHWSRQRAGNRRGHWRKQEPPKAMSRVVVSW